MKSIFLIILSFLLFDQNCCEITSLDVLTKTYNIELNKPPNVTEPEIDIYFGHQKDKKHRDADGQFREKPVDFTKLKPKKGQPPTENDLNEMIHFNKLLLEDSDSPDMEFGSLPVLKTVHCEGEKGAVVIGYVTPRVDINLSQLNMQKFIPSWAELIKIIETGFYTIENIHLRGVILKNIRLDNFAFGLKPHTNKLDIETDDNVLYFLKFLPDNKPYEAKGGKRVKLEESHSPATDIHAYCFTMLEFFVGTRLAGSHTIKQPPTKTKDIMMKAKKDFGKDKVHEHDIYYFFDGCFEKAAKLATSTEKPKEEWYDDLRSKLSKHKPLSKKMFEEKYEFKMDFHEKDAIASGQSAHIFAGSQKDNKKGVVFKKLTSHAHSDVTKEVYYNDIMSGENTHILPVLDTVYYEDEENIVNGYVQTQVDKDLYTSAIETKSPKWNDAKIIILDVLNILEEMHLKFDIFHNDVKAENLAYGLGSDNKKLFLLDFGDSERYKIRGKPIKYEKHLDIETGTAAYQCVESLEGWTRGPIDDIHDFLMSMFVVFLNTAKLPWDDDEDMCEMKRELCTVKKIVNAIEEEVGVKYNFAEHEKEIYTFFQECFDFVKEKHKKSRESGVIQIPDKTWYEQLRGYLK